MAELKRILHVDDDNDIRAIAKMALETFGGYEVTQFSSGQAALDGVAGLKPDVILLDVMMPGMDGVETMLCLRMIPGCDTPPVIFMTAKSQEHEVRALKAQGAQDVILKPFDPMTLSQRVHEIWSATVETA